jgi:hypothetical protein
MYAAAITFVCKYLLGTRQQEYVLEKETNQKFHD